MALSNVTLKFLKEELLDKIELPIKSSVCLGYPRMTDKISEIDAIFNSKSKVLNFNEIMQKLYASKVNHVLDTNNYENPDILADLNNPINIEKKYQVVIDNGTIEHCFNIAQAIDNCKLLCELDGYIIHMNPANWWGHGFYNLSPCFYFDFYRANGFEVRVFLRDVGKGKITEIKYRPKLTVILDKKRFTMHAIAKKIKEVDTTFPMQGRYQNFIWNKNV